MGIFACSVSGHSTFPALRASMHAPSQFPRVIWLSFSSMMAIYCTVAAVGFWYFGDQVTTLVVEAMAQGSVYSRGKATIGGLQVGVGDAVAVLVGLRAATAFPAVVMVLQVRSIRVRVRIGSRCCRWGPSCIDSFLVLRSFSLAVTAS